jgi:hypothetical protein
MLSPMVKPIDRTSRQAPGGGSAPDARWRPEVIVDFVFDEGKFFVAIENLGDRAAVDVSIRFDRAFRGAGGDRDISSLPLFRNIPFLAPRRRITTFLDTSAAYFARREPTSLSVAVSYADPDGTKYENVIRHDLAIYRDVSYVQPSRPSPRQE